MPYVTAVQAKKQALAGAMRLLVEGSMGAWYARRSSWLGIRVLNEDIFTGQEIINTNAHKATAVHLRRCLWISSLLSETAM